MKREVLLQHAWDVVNANDETKRAQQELLFLCLDKLTSKYGERANFLSIRADFTPDRTLRRDLLHRAYELAVSAGEHEDVTEAALSLVSVAIGDFPDLETAEQWLAIAREHLTQFVDEDGLYRRHVAELQEELQEMRRKRLVQ